MSPIPLPVNPLPGADVPGSTAEAQQANNDALAIGAVPLGSAATARVVWNNQAGPLTLSSAQSMRGGLVLALWSGSGFRSVGNGTGLVTVELFLDGTSLGLAERFTNETVSHKSTITGAAVHSVTTGSHTWELRASTTTTTDSSDRYMLTLVEF